MAAENLVKHLPAFQPRGLNFKKVGTREIQVHYMDELLMDVSFVSTGTTLFFSNDNSVQIKNFYHHQNFYWWQVNNGFFITSLFDLIINFICKMKKYRK